MQVSRVNSRLFLLILSTRTAAISHFVQTPEKKLLPLAHETSIIF